MRSGDDPKAVRLAKPDLLKEIKRLAELDRRPSLTNMAELLLWEAISARKAAKK
jgi:hypothetical protein